jgi:hypothetical protein
MGIPVVIKAVVKLLVGGLKSFDQETQHAALASRQEIGRRAIQPLPSVLSASMPAERRAAVLEVLGALARVDAHAV